MWQKSTFGVHNQIRLVTCFKQIEISGSETRHKVSHFRVNSLLNLAKFSSWHSNIVNFLIILLFEVHRWNQSYKLTSKF